MPTTSHRTSTAPKRSDRNTGTRTKKNTNERAARSNANTTLPRNQATIPRPMATISGSHNTSFYTARSRTSSALGRNSGYLASSNSERRSRRVQEGDLNDTATSGAPEARGGTRACRGLPAQLTRISSWSTNTQRSVRRLERAANSGRGIRESLIAACKAMRQDSTFRAFADKYKGTKSIMKKALGRLPQVYAFVSWTLQHTITGMKYCASAIGKVWEHAPKDVQMLIYVFCISLVTVGVALRFLDKIIDSPEAYTSLLTNRFDYGGTIHPGAELTPHMRVFDPLTFASRPLQ